LARAAPDRHHRFLEREHHAGRVGRVGAVGDEQRLTAGHERFARRTAGGRAGVDALARDLHLAGRERAGLKKRRWRALGRELGSSPRQRKICFTSSTDRPEGTSNMICERIGLARGR
jgi:hypothetical protein